MVEPSAELVAWRDKYAAEQARARGERLARNGETTQSTAFVASRRATDEAAEIFLRLRHAEFYTQMAVQRLDRPFAARTTPRSHYLDGVIPRTVQAFGLRFRREHRAGHGRRPARRSPSGSTQPVRLDAAARAAA
jgi:hypothetical protein